MAGNVTNRPTVRSTRSTRDKTTAVLAHKSTLQPSRRVVSTRHRQVIAANTTNTNGKSRQRVSTRSNHAQLTTNKKRTDRTKQKESLRKRLAGYILKKPEEREAAIISPKEDDVSNYSRTQLQGERRETKRNLAPVQFITAMFVVVIVSVFAFGILRGDLSAQRTTNQDSGSTPNQGPGEEVIYGERGTTSTNTGILRGS